MKEIYLKKMQLTNFKGVRDLSIDFGTKTDVFGDNGTGKSTIMDAFMWCLFGKDRKDRKEFAIKTYDKDGVVIPDIPHEVEVTLTVDGENIVLTKRYNETWTKRRGSAVKEMTGHEEERLYNNVPCTLKEWNSKIDAVCSEQVFKLITNSRYFCSLKADQQREMLFRMAGEISDADVVAGQPNLEQLLADMTGKTLAEYKKEIQAKKRRVKTECDALPTRINERRRDIQDAEDWDALKEEKATLETKRNELDKVLISAAENAKKKMTEAKNRIQVISEMKKTILYRENEIRSSANKDYNTKVEALDQIKRSIKIWENDREDIQRTIDRTKSNKDAAIKEMDALRQKWYDKNAEELQINENDFVCPTCGRRYEVEEIAKRRDSIVENFNASKAHALDSITTSGLKLRDDVKEYEERIAELEERKAKLTALILSNQTQVDSFVLGEKTDCTEAIANDEEILRLKQDIARLEEVEIVEEDTTDIKIQRDDLTRQIKELDARLAMQKVIDANIKRIGELEIELRKNSEELAMLEGIEFNIMEFSKRKADIVEGRVSSLFENVKFKLFDRQINGEEIEVCEATMDGVPYSVLNDAKQINCGIDIINAICKYEGIHAPIFVDNAESINNIIDTDSQLIRLVVSTDKQLRIQSNDK